ncbi:MAG: VWA domain-containing protein [Deltaproteobacteria bacterium]|nr:VWA domain-containing protein [Deltaproteobacteria bacterium]
MSEIPKSMSPIVSRHALLSRGVVKPTIGTARKQHVIIAPDRSGSMRGAPFEEALAGTKALADELAKPENLDAFLLATAPFNHIAALTPFQPAASVVLPAGTSADGMTDFTKPLQLALDAFAPYGAPESDPNRPTLVFLTDGKHEPLTPSDPTPLALALKKIANVVAIALGPDADLGFLALMASGPTFVTRVTDPRQLRTFMGAVGATLSRSRRAGRSIAAASMDPFASRRHG